MKILKTLAPAFVTFILVYLLFSFIELDLNAAHWNYEARKIAGIITLIMGGIGILMSKVD